jgi:hypothetical protein
LLPLTVNVNAAPPTLTAVGLTDATTGGAGGETVKLVVACPPSGAGFITATCTVPLVPTSVALMLAVSCEALTKVVGLGAPFQLTVDVERKFEPVSVNEKLLVPALALVGEMEVMLGRGFDGGGVGVELPPPHDQSKKLTESKLRIDTLPIVANFIVVPRCDV